MIKRLVGAAMAVLLAVTPALGFVQQLPHMKTSGFTYGFPQEVENLEFIASKMDMVIGIGEWQEKYATEFQYDTMKAINPDLLIVPYSVIQAFTFDHMKQVFIDYIDSRTTDPTERAERYEALYIHYQYDNVVKARVTIEKTSGTGTPSDYVCDVNGNLLTDGQRSYYYWSLGYDGDTDTTDGSSATTIEDSRAYQYWNSGFRERMWHFGPDWQAAYPLYLKEILTSAPGKYGDGVFLDTYQGIIDKDGYLPNFHQLREVIASGYGADDAAARTWFSETFVQYMDTVSKSVGADLGKPDIFFVANWGDMGYAEGTYLEFVEDWHQYLDQAYSTLEYIDSPSKSAGWKIRGYWAQHFNRYATQVWVDHVDSSWLGKILEGNTHTTGGLVPEIWGRQWMIGLLYLFLQEDSFFSSHYGTASAYGPGVYPNIGEDKGGLFSESHWDVMLDYDIGTPVVITDGSLDLNGNANTDMMRVHTVELSDGYPIPDMYIMDRTFTRARIMLRAEQSDNFEPYDPNMPEYGTDPRQFDLGGDLYCTLDATGNPDGVLISEVTLGRAQAKILIPEALCGELTIGTINFTAADTGTLNFGANGSGTLTLTPGL